MENIWSWEQKALITELIQGLQLAKQLKLSSSTPSDDSKRVLVQRILASFQRSLLILDQSSVSLGQPPQCKGPVISLPESPLSVNGSPPTDDFDGGIRISQGLKAISKKRKMLPQKTQQTRVASHNGMEGPHEDGYSWRKYGQKDILGAKYPRSYYRCTYRNTQNCLATKKVQRSEQEPSKFEITYHGEHTCFQATNPIPAPASPDIKQKSKHSIHNQQESEHALSNLRASLCVDTELLAHKELASPFSFPSTSSENMNDQNHTSLQPMVQWQTDNFIRDHYFQHAESGPTETLLAKTSNTNSPMPDLDFPLDLDEIYQNLATQNPGLFPYFC